MKAGIGVPPRRSRAILRSHSRRDQRQGKEDISTTQRSSSSATIRWSSANAEARVRATAKACAGGDQPIASSSLLKNPRQNESSLIQFFYHESVEARMRGAFTDQGQLFSYISP